MNAMFKDLLTESDGVTYDLVRWLAVVSILVGLGLSVFSVVVKGQAFSLQDFGIGIGAVFLSVGAALKLKEPTTAQTTVTQTTTATEVKP